MRRPGTLGEVMATAWAQRIDTGPRPAWASVLEAGHVQTWIMRTVATHPPQLLAELPGRDASGVPDPADEPQGMTAELPPDRARRLRAWIGSADAWAIVDALAAAAARLVEDTARLLREQPAPPPIDERRLSEWACAAVVRPYRVAPALPSASYLLAEGTVRRQLLTDQHARVRALPTAAEFAQRYAAELELTWERHGAQARARYRPEELGLGRLRRPPMTAADNGWRRGTDRSVEARYGYHLRLNWGRDPEATAARAGLDRSTHLGERLGTMAPEEVCTGVLRRACSSLGLRFPRHRAMLATVHRGLVYADVADAHATGRGRRGTLLAEWTAHGPRLPDAEDPTLRAAVSAHAGYWAARQKHTNGVVLALPETIANWPVLVPQAALRKLWHLTLSREVEWEAEFVRAEVSGHVRKMFSRHLWELLDRPALDVEPPGQAEPRAVGPDDPRVGATQAAIAGHPELALFLFHFERAEPDWHRLYLEIVGASAQRCLTLEEFIAWNDQHGSGGRS